MVENTLFRGTTEPALITQSDSPNSYTVSTSFNADQSKNYLCIFGAGGGGQSQTHNMSATNANIISQQSNGWVSSMIIKPTSQIVTISCTCSGGGAYLGSSCAVYEV